MYDVESTVRRAIHVAVFVVTISKWQRFGDPSVCLCVSCVGTYGIIAIIM